MIRAFRCRVSACVLILTLLVTAPAPAGWTADSPTLGGAFTNLVTGRAYLKDYPGLVTRNMLVNDFLGSDESAPNRQDLKAAVAKAIAIRQASPPEPESLPPGKPPESLQAKVIAWEALESLQTGYVYAGNRDLLRAVRVAYPGDNFQSDNRELPVEEGTEFEGTAQKEITYARLYFLQAVKDVLEYIAEDRTGQLRASGNVYPDLPHYVSFDEEGSELLPFPGFDDPNFGDGPPPDGLTYDREPSQSSAFLHGTAMERLGLAAVAYADQLWRAAFAGPGAGVKRDEAQKAGMLDRATEVLQENIHAQFLASLPLAAQLSDGTDGTLNEYELAKLNQARVSVTDALRLRETILAGEKPTQTALVSAWDKESIKRQIGRCEAAYAAVLSKWGDGEAPADPNVKQALEDAEDAQTAGAEREAQLRNSLESQLLEITGIDPAFYGHLRTNTTRLAFLTAVTNKFDALIDNRDPNAGGLQDGSLMSVQALRLMQAIQEGVAKRAEVDGFAQRMSIEVERNDDENATVVINGIAYEAIELAIGVADATPNISVCACGMASGTITHTDPSAAITAAQAALRVMRTATETVTINAINSRALIRNLLIDQQIAIEELGAVLLNVAIARAELLQLLATANRLVADHAFYAEVTDQLWYRDPTLLFRVEVAEEEYAGLLQQYRIELYKLARMLEAAWTERFANPVKQSNGSTIKPLNNGSYDGFTEAESVFAVANHVQARAFYDALKAWDGLLRGPSYRGEYASGLKDANSFSGQPISLRRDIFKLLDYRYDDQSNTYLKDEALERRSIQRFRAILLDLANRDPKNLAAGRLARLRIDFPLTYGQSRIILGQDSPVPIIAQNRPGAAFDQYWNHRIRKLAVRIVGKNVFAAGETQPVALELFGTADRIGFFPDSLYTKSRTITTFQIPLYQRDPDKRLVGEAFFGDLGIQAVIGDTQVDVDKFEDIAGWPLFCDNFVLRIDAQGTMRIENLEDIELYMEMELGSPPPIAWP